MSFLLVTESEALKVLSELKTMNLNALTVNKFNGSSNFNSTDSIKFQLSPAAVPMNKDERERELLLALAKIVVPTPTPSPPANAARPKNPSPVSVPSLKSKTPPRSPTKTKEETTVITAITTTNNSNSDDADLPGDLELESPATETKEQQVDPTHAVCIKAFYKDDVRRIMFDSRTGFKKLVEQAKKIYPFEPILKYRDDDCELVTIGSDDDLSEVGLFPSFQ